MRLIILNAVYFKGEWASRFQKELTAKKPFYSAEGQEREVVFKKAFAKNLDYSRLDGEEVALIS